jgi:hypothetical protein
MLALLVERLQRDCVLYVCVCVCGGGGGEGGRGVV